MKKSEDNHKLTDNGKKDGIIHDGIIHEEAISEVGSQEELFYSKEGMFAVKNLIIILDHLWVWKTRGNIFSVISLKFK